MPDSNLEELIKHNNWANDLIIKACSSLTEAQLDAHPSSVTAGPIRETLLHLVQSQAGYFRLLTSPVEERRKTRPTLAFDGIAESARTSGEGLLALVRDERRLASLKRLHTTDDYWVEPWVALVQVINHATEHREQIKSMLSALGVTPPDIDAWAYAEAVHAMVPVDKPTVS